MPKFTPSLRSASEPDRNALLAVRAIVVAASDPKVKLTVNDLARATGLTPEVIYEMLRTKEYRELLQDTCKQRVATLIQKSITVLEDLLGSENDKTKMDAVSKITSLYTALNKDAGHQAAAGEKAAEDLLQYLDSLRRCETTTVATQPLEKNG